MDLSRATLRLITRDATLEVRREALTPTFAGAEGLCGAYIGAEPYDTYANWRLGSPDPGYDGFALQVDAFYYPMLTPGGPGGTLVSGSLLTQTYRNATGPFAGDFPFAVPLLLRNKYTSPTPINWQTSRRAYVAFENQPYWQTRGFTLSFVVVTESGATLYGDGGGVEVWCSGPPGARISATNGASQEFDEYADSWDVATQTILQPDKRPAELVLVASLTSSGQFPYTYPAPVAGRAFVFRIANGDPLSIPGGNGTAGSGSEIIADFEITPTPT